MKKPLSRPYIYNLRSELYELETRLRAGPDDEESASLRDRIARIKKKLGDDVLPFSLRQKAKHSEAVKEHLSDLADGDKALEEIEKMLDSKLEKKEGTSND